MARPGYFMSYNTYGSEVKPVVNQYDIEQLVKDAYGPEKWKSHVVNDLMKFWMKKEPSSLEEGLFPTFLTNEGKIVSMDPAEWPPELIEAGKDKDISGLLKTDYNFLRAHSRQTYAYGVAYHMTGNMEYLDMCKKGAEAIMEAVDTNYGLYSLKHRETGKLLPSREQRDSQDLAYGIAGLAMYYFLTHDEATLHIILQAKEYIFRTYLDEDRGLFTWYPKVRDDGDIEIVAQLDQIYGYMMFLTPALPEPYKSEWKGQLRRIAEILITRFYSERYQFFWGTENTGVGNDSRKLGADHTDFGHSIKTMWLIYKIGLLVHEPSFVIFAREKMDHILSVAYDTETFSWNRRFNDKGKIDTDKEWWILAELDQACELLSIFDPSYLDYLNHTTKYWFDYMVDKENGEIYHWVNGTTNEPDLRYPKAHCWKNAFHSFEHALFGYMTAAQIKGQEFTLYYAFKTEQEVKDTAVPYMFSAKKVKVDVDAASIECMPGEHESFKVTYKSLY